MPAGGLCGTRAPRTGCSVRRPGVAHTRRGRARTPLAAAACGRPRDAAQEQGRHPWAQAPIPRLQSQTPVSGRGSQWAMVALPTPLGTQSPGQGPPARPWLACPSLESRCDVHEHQCRGSPPSPGGQEAGRGRGRGACRAAPTAGPTEHAPRGAGARCAKTKAALAWAKGCVTQARHQLNRLSPPTSPPNGPWLEPPGHSPPAVAAGPLTHCPSVGPAGQRAARHAGDRPAGPGRATACRQCWGSCCHQTRSPDGRTPRPASPRTPTPTRGAALTLE